MEIFPAIDLLDGSAVRLQEGQYNRLTVYSNNPVELAKQIESTGATNLHIVDLSGAKDPSNRQKDLVQRVIQATRLQIQYGGGIRNLNDVREILELGVKRVILGSIAISKPELTLEILKEFGAHSVTLALDVKIQVSGEIKLTTEAWQKTTDLDFYALIDRYAQNGLTRILCTDIGKDGMLSGPNLELYQMLIEKFPMLQIQASGGVSSLQDLRRLASIGVHSTIVGKALYEGRFSLPEALTLC